MTDLEQADEAARKLCHAYALLGFPAFVLRGASDNQTAIIGPKLQPQSVAVMLAQAAVAYVAQVPAEPMQ